MRVLLVGAGGVGTALARTAARRGVFEHIVVADLALERAQRAAHAADDRFEAVALDASDEAAVEELLRATRSDVLVNAVDPRFVMPLFNAALHAGVTYLDMAMSLSHPHPEHPYADTGVKLGDEQFALAAAWEARGQLALVGMGVEPGLSDVFARYAADNLFSHIDEIGVRDGANLVVEGYDFAPTFSIWTTIEECLNPPVIWEHDRGWFTTEPFSELEVFDFPAGIGAVECVNVEHEEVLLVPRWVDTERVTFKYGLGEEFIWVLKTLHKLGLDATTPVQVGESFGITARRGRGVPARPGRARGQDARGHVRRDLGDRHRSRRQPPRRLPVPRRRQRLDDGGVRLPGRGVADRGQPRCGARARGRGCVVGCGCARVPRPSPLTQFLEVLVEHGAPWGLDERGPKRR